MVLLRTFNKIIGFVSSVKCPNCGEVTIFKKIKNISRVLVFIFIPVFQMTNACYVQCDKCGATYQVEKKALKNMETSDQLMNAIMAWHNKIQKKKK